MTSYTARELDDILARHHVEDRSIYVIGLGLVALSGAVIGFIFGWLAKGWLA